MLESNSSVMDINYFTCTLSQATLIEGTGKYKNVNDLIDQQFSRVPDLPAIGFYQPNSDSVTAWECRILTFRDVWNASNVTARVLLKTISIPIGRSVALLCPSSAEFLFVWLALIRLGHPVLLLAPQCSPTAIRHLCKICEIHTLFYDEVYSDLAHRASGPGAEANQVHFTIQSVLSGGTTYVFELMEQGSAKIIVFPSANETDIAYLHHTSGTSTGVPKPIPQSHRAAVGVLPCLDGSKHATFTTTPLYHGGIADLFRAWTSDAMIWLFPGKEIPITAANIARCLEIATKSSKDTEAPPVRYISLVPYVLQMMAGDKQGLEYLQHMDIVGVGGAALPTAVGDELVRNGVHLVSRFGSAECGFLMSSHRNYALDNEWQYLRPGDGVQHLSFESRECELSELVILSGWPQMAKRNRYDGSYATADLFVPNNTIANAWRYHSRADSQLTLITGKKFDPAPLEDAMVSATPLLSNILIFGNGRPYPGALLFRSLAAKEVSDSEIIQNLAPIVEKLNTESQNHARLPRNMLIPVAYEEQSLQKSSKGTILRGSAEERYKAEIEGAYTSLALEGSEDDVPDGTVSEKLLSIVKSIVGESADHQNLSMDTDLFSAGVDSVACVQIRHALGQLLSKSSCANLSLTIVEDSSTVCRLAEFVIERRHCKAAPSHTENDERQQRWLMQDLVKEFSVLQGNSKGRGEETDQEAVEQEGRKSGSVHAQNLRPVNPSLDHQGSETVILTGSTGSLGSHILHQLLSSTSTSAVSIFKIYLLIRGASPTGARERVRKALLSRGLVDLDKPSTIQVEIVQVNLLASHLGLSEDFYVRLTKEATSIIHAAWAVNFLLPLRSFRGHLAGLRNLFDLAITGQRQRGRGMRFLFASSVASVASLASAIHGSPVEDGVKVNMIPEQVLPDPTVAGEIGYSRSKWVAEQICAVAAQQAALNGRVAVLRIGQLSGDTENGVWNASEGWPLMIGSVKEIGALPDLGRKEALAWLPVDTAAKACVEVLGTMTGDGEDDNGDHIPCKEKGLGVYHILNDGRDATWANLLDWMKKKETFEVVSPAEWVARLEKLKESGCQHQCLRLLGFWKKVYADVVRDDVDGGAKQEAEERKYSMSLEGRYGMEETFKAAPCLRELDSVNEKYFEKLWNWIAENVK